MPVGRSHYTYVCFWMHTYISRRIPEDQARKRQWAAIGVLPRAPGTARACTQPEARQENLDIS